VVVGGGGGDSVDGCGGVSYQLLMWPHRSLPKALIRSLSMNLTSHFDGEEVLAALRAMNYVRS